MLSTYTKIFIALSVMVALASCSSKGKNKASAAGNPSGAASATIVEAVVVKPRPLDRKINVTGTIIANEEIELRSEISGKVTSISFSEGNRVQKGQLLVKIIDSDLQAELKKLVLQDTLISRDEFRKGKLLEMNAISREEYDNVLTQLHTIRAEKHYVLAQIEKTEIRSPFDGMAGLRYVSEGGFVSPTSLIATLQQINPVKVEFSVPERYRNYMQSGTEIYFTTTGSDENFKAIVYAIEAKIDPATRTVKVRARCSNDKNLLTPGAFAKVEIVLERMDSALVVPAQAVIPELNGQKVFLVKNGEAQVSKIEVGIRTDSETEILSGINEGDTLALTGLLQLRPGSKVEVKLRAE